jgi:DNA-binding PadR family transcriptional regulator
MRRKPGELRPIETDILETALRLRARGVGEFHGFMIAKEMAEAEDAKVLAAQGTLYRALNRIELAGLVESRWEEQSEASPAHRPLRRLYKLTVAGEQAVAKQRKTTATHGPLRGTPRRAST